MGATRNTGPGSCVGPPSVQVLSTPGSRPRGGRLTTHPIAGRRIATLRLFGEAALMGQHSCFTGVPKSIAQPARNFGTSVRAYRYRVAKYVVGHRVTYCCLA
jgi:hypothetical protein